MWVALGEPRLGTHRTARDHPGGSGRFRAFRVGSEVGSPKAESTLSAFDLRQCQQQLINDLIFWCYELINFRASRSLNPVRGGSGRFGRHRSEERQ